MRRALLLAVAGALLLVPAAGAWSWPATGAVLQPYNFDPAHPYAAGQHRGLDVGGAAGSAVAAPRSGTVTFAGSVPSSGMCVTIETADGYSVTLTHLGSLAVAQGSVVAEGDTVGTVGPSGDPEVTQPYVHLGVRVTAQAQGYVDPATLLPARAAAAPDPALAIVHVSVLEQTYSC
jgi:murein DD-endopeptidase MepM/ murein hydrolase activator NlpD